MSTQLPKAKLAFLKKAAKRYGDRYDYANVVYRGLNTRITIRCRLHGLFKLHPKEHLDGSACSSCKESKGEARIRVFLEKHDIKHVQEYRIDPFQYRYDFYLPKLKVLIEFHGQQHYKPVAIFGGESGYKKTVKRDKAKRELAKRNKLKLITLSYRGTMSNNLERILKASLSCAGHAFKPTVSVR